MKPPSSVYLTLLVTFALGVASTQAIELFSENFESRTNGDLNGQNGFTALLAADVETGGLSYANGGVSVLGGTQNATVTGLTPANNWVFVNTFAPQSDTVYFSLALTWTNQQVDDFLYFALSNDADTAPAALANSAGAVINGFGTGTPGLIGGRIRENSIGNTTQTSSGVVGGGSTISTQFIAGSLSKVSSTNYNTLRLFVNPTSTTEGTPTLTITRDMGIASGLDTFFLFSGATNEADETIKVDNITIGTTFADVVVPEPATGAMLLGGVGMLVGTRRLRRNRVA